MQYLTNEEIVRLGRLVRKINLAGADNSASDLEEVERGLARLDNAGLIMVMLVACNLEGKPFIFSGDNPETKDRCRSFAEYLGISVDEVVVDDRRSRIVFGSRKIGTAGLLETAKRARED
jgi:hypothetical protein